MKKASLLSAALCLAASLSAQNPKGEVYMASNAHLDSQWLWTVQQVIGEYLPNTLYQNFKLLEDYPDYKFTLEGAIKYEWFKEYYPEAYEKGKPISGLESVKSSVCFHAGTTMSGEKVVTSGGRVVAVSSYGDTIFDALSTSYASAEGISFDKCYYRTDLGFDLK